MDAIFIDELMPRSTKETRRYSVVLPVPIANKLEELAAKEGRSFSQMIAKLVERGIEQMEDKE